MHDLKYFSSNIEEAITKLERRDGDYSHVRKIADLDKKRKEIISEVEVLKAKRNETSKLIGQYKREGKDISEIQSSVSSIGDTIKSLDNEQKEVELEIKQILEALPHFIDEDVPKGKDDTENVELSRWGQPNQYNYEPKAHWDLGTDLDIIDFSRATKIASTRFASFKRDGAFLERALINFCLTRQIAKGYEEIKVPYVTNEEVMYGTAKIPKFVGDFFKLDEERDLFLIPTAEVQLVGYHMNEILDESDLPINYTSYSECFRSEAGSAGRDTRGIIRLHQFPKVELVKFTTEESSYDELEKMTKDAEAILEELNLPYRKVLLCSGDTGFNSAKTYDLEVWLPSYNDYKEISSVSNTTDFQTRRANIKYRDAEGKLKFAHSLNGSGLAIGRLMAAVMENYQQENGTILIPEPLQPFMGGKKVITK